VSKKWTRRSALGLIGSGAGLLTWGTGGFTEVQGDRNVSLDTQPDPDGLVGFGAGAASGDPGEQVDLFDLTNNFGDSMSVDEVTITDASGDLTTGDLSNIGSPPSIGPGSTGTVTGDIPGNANVGSGQISFKITITVSQGDVSTTLDRTVDLTVNSTGFTGLVYADGNDKAHFLAADGSSDTGTNRIMKALGPISDFDGDGTTEVLVVGNNGKIKEIENLKNPNVRTIPNTSGPNRAIKEGKISVGDWDGDGTLDIFYGDQNDNLRRVERDGSEGEILVNSPTTAVAGFGDITGDGTKEVVYSKGTTLQYYKNGGTETQFASGLTSGKAIGPLADYNGDGTLQVAIVTNGPEVALVDGNGTVTTITNGEDPRDLPMAAVDITSDGTLEIAYVPNSPPNDRTINYTDINGNIGSITGNAKVQELGLSGSATAGLNG
jgi:hypothetical protein